MTIMRWRGNSRAVRGHAGRHSKDTVQDLLWLRKQVWKGSGMPPRSGFEVRRPGSGLDSLKIQIVATGVGGTEEA